MTIKFFFPAKFNAVSLVAFVLLFTFQLRFGIIPGFNNINSDFPNYYVSSKLVLQNQNTDSLYHDSWFENKIAEQGITEHGKFAPFPPPTVLIMMPFANFSPGVAKKIWTVVNIALLFACGLLIQKIIQCNIFSALNVVLLSGIALANNFYLGQVYLLILVLCLGGYLLLSSSKFTGGSVLIAVAATLKYFPVVFLLPFLKRKTILWFCTTILFLFGLSFVLIGGNAFFDFFRGVFFNHLNGNLSSQSPYAWQFQSLNSLLMNVFVFHSVQNPLPIFNAPAAFHFFKWIVSIVVLMATVFYVNKLREKRDFSEWFIILVSAALFVLLPASASYHLLFLVLSVTLLLKQSNQTGEERFFILPVLFYICAGFIPFLIDNMFEMESINVFLRYSRLYFVCLFFVSVLLSAKKYLRKELGAD